MQLAPAENEYTNPGDEPEPPPLGAALARGLREGASPDAPAAGESPATNWQARAEKAEARLERFRAWAEPHIDRGDELSPIGFLKVFEVLGMEIQWSKCRIVIKEDE